MTETDPPLFFLVAGESSGDLLGGRLMAALKEHTKGHIRFAGIGGPRMQAQGMDLLFPQSELALFGLAELLPKIPHILKRLRETARTVKRLKPDAVITIDAPDFSFRLGKKLQGANIPLIHYAAPTVWAWRPKRAAKIAKFLSSIMTLFPFEPPYFTREGLRADYVGHPLVETMASQFGTKSFREKHQLAQDIPLLAILPGSRMSEVTCLIPEFRTAVTLLKEKLPNLVCVTAIAPGVDQFARAALADWPTRLIIIDQDSDKYAAFDASTAALAASGTVALELALAGLPAVIAYRIHALTAFLYRRLITTRYVNLVNIMHDRMVVPELIQDYCRADFMAASLLPLLQNTSQRQRQIEDLKATAGWLGAGAEAPSHRAARTVLDVAKIANQQ